MKKILIFAVAAVAVCAVLAKTKTPSKAEIEKQDKANWGGVDYSAAPDGENSVANDLAQMRSMARGEAATMKKLFDFCKLLINGAKIVDMEPETVLGDALKQLGRPIDPTPPRTHSNLSATPAQKLGFKSLQGAKRAVGKFGKEARPKMAVLLKTEIEERIFSNYNRLVRVANLDIIKNGALVSSFEKVDRAWGNYLKILDQISKGTDKWKYYPAQLRNPETRKKLFAEVLKESGLDCALDADGRLHAKSSRSLRRSQEIRGQYRTLLQRPQRGGRLAEPIQGVVCGKRPVPRPLSTRVHQGTLPFPRGIHPQKPRSAGRLLEGLGRPAQRIPARRQIAQVQGFLAEQGVLREKRRSLGAAAVIRAAHERTGPRGKDTLRGRSGKAHRHGRAHSDLNPAGAGIRRRLPRAHLGMNDMLSISTSVN